MIAENNEKADDSTDDKEEMIIESDTDYEVTEVTETVERQVQIEQYEPYKVSETRVALVRAGDPDEVADLLHDQTKESVQRKIMKRVEEKEMKDKLEGN